MKKYLSLFWVFILITSVFSVNAQSFYGSNGQNIGRIDSDGTIRNFNGSSIGKIDKDGIIRNSNGAQVGKIDSDGTIRDRNNSSMEKLTLTEPFAINTMLLLVESTEMELSEMLTELR